VNSPILSFILYLRRSYGHHQSQRQRLLMLHNSIRDALSVDDNTTGPKPFGMPDWRPARPDPRSSSRLGPRHGCWSSSGAEISRIFYSQQSHAGVVPLGIRQMTTPPACPRVSQAEPHPWSANLKGLPRPHPFYSDSVGVLVFSADVCSRPAVDHL
jgi:hypothetical protein